MRLVSRDHSLILPFRCPSSASSLRDSRDLPIELSGVSDRRAGAAMFAIPSVPVEEDEMRRAPSVHLLVDPIEKLNGGVRTTLPKGIERLDGHVNDRAVSGTTSDDGQRALS